MTTDIVGIIAFSFAKRDKEPNPVNVRLAFNTDLVDDELQSGGVWTVVVAQWEIARALSTAPHTIVSIDDATPKADGKIYLDSKDVLNKAIKVFEGYRITDVIVVANNFLHRRIVESMARKAGYTIMKAKMPAVGFDPSPLNLQWWCKGPVRFVTYLGVQVLGKLVGRNLHGIGEKPTSQKEPSH